MSKTPDVTPFIDVDRNQRVIQADSASILYSRLRWNLPMQVIQNEVNGLYGAQLTQELSELIELYNIYDEGAAPRKKQTEDYIPSDTNIKKIRTLINKEARFMFSNPPTYQVTVLRSEEDDTERQISLLDGIDEDDLRKDNPEANVKKDETAIQRLLDKVLKKNMFNAKLVRAAKDCFIGKRIAIFVNFSINSGIQIQIAPSLEFIYETDPNTDEISKIVAFFMQVNNENKEHQRFFKKKYEMINGLCYFSQGLYDGNGNIVEDENNVEEENTGLPFVPAVVILNEGLTGDLLGESEVSQLSDYERVYSQLGNDDIDAERQSMNSVLYTVNASRESTANISRRPGAYLDLQSEPDLPDGMGDTKIGLIESSMNYSNALDMTMRRINNHMHESIDIPDVNMETMSGVVTSGKALRALYWPLIVRCNEKMLQWAPKMEEMCNIIIEGAKTYPEITKLYVDEQLPDTEYNIEVKNSFPIMEDENEEKAMSLQEVDSKVMSRRTYMKRYYKLTDAEALDEIRQIAMERQILEDSFDYPSFGAKEQIQTETQTIEEPEVMQDKEEITTTTTE